MFLLLFHAPEWVWKVWVLLTLDNFKFYRICSLNPYGNKSVSSLVIVLGHPQFGVG